MFRRTKTKKTPGPQVGRERHSHNQTKKYLKRATRELENIIEAVSEQVTVMIEHDIEPLWDATINDYTDETIEYININTELEKEIALHERTKDQLDVVNAQLCDLFEIFDEQNAILIKHRLEPIDYFSINYLEFTNPVYNEPCDFNWERKQIGEDSF